MYVCTYVLLSFVKLPHPHSSTLISLQGALIICRGWGLVIAKFNAPISHARKVPNNHGFLGDRLCPLKRAHNQVQRSLLNLCRNVPLNQKQKQLRSSLQNQDLPAIFRHVRQPILQVSTSPIPMEDVSS